MADVPYRLLPHSAAHLVDLTVPPPPSPVGRSRPPNHSYCSNCWKGGYLYMCEKCTRSYHGDCLTFMGRAEVRGVRARGPWSCTFCRSDAAGKRRMTAEANKNFARFQRERLEEEESLKEERIEFALRKADDPHANYMAFIMEHERVKVNKRKGKKRKRPNRSQRRPRPSDSNRHHPNTQPQPHPADEEKGSGEEVKDDHMQYDGGEEEEEEKEDYEAPLDRAADDLDDLRYESGDSALDHPPPLSDWDDDDDDMERASASPQSLPSSELVSDGGPTTPHTDLDDMDPLQPGDDEDEVGAYQRPRYPPPAQPLLPRLPLSPEHPRARAIQLPPREATAKAVHEALMAVHQARSQVVNPRPLHSPVQPQLVLAQPSLRTEVPPQVWEPPSSHPPTFSSDLSTSSPSLSSPSSTASCPPLPSLTTSSAPLSDFFLQAERLGFKLPEAKVTLAMEKSEVAALEVFQYMLVCQGQGKEEKMCDQPEEEKKEAVNDDLGDDEEGDDDVQWIPHPSQRISSHTSSPSLTHSLSTRSSVVPSSLSLHAFTPSSTALPPSAPPSQAVPATTSMSVSSVPPAPTPPAPVSAPTRPAFVKPVSVRHPRLQLALPTTALSPYPVVKPDPAPLSTFAAAPSRQSHSASSSVTQPSAASMEEEKDCWYTVSLNTEAVQPRSIPSPPTAAIDSRPPLPSPLPAPSQPPRVSTEPVAPLLPVLTPATTRASHAASRSVVAPTPSTSSSSSSLETQSVVQPSHSPLSVFAPPSSSPPPPMPSKRQSKKTQRFIESEELEATLPPLDPIGNSRSRVSGGKRKRPTKRKGKNWGKGKKSSTHSPQVSRSPVHGIQRPQLSAQKAVSSGPRCPRVRQCGGGRKGRVRGGGRGGGGRGEGGVVE